MDWYSISIIVPVLQYYALNHAYSQNYGGMLDMHMCGEVKIRLQ